jgi:hypothetical protein
MEVSYWSHEVKIKRNINKWEDALARDLREPSLKLQTRATIATKSKEKYPRYNTIDNNTDNNDIYYSIIKYHNINICRAMKQRISLYCFSFLRRFVISVNVILGERIKSGIFLTSDTFRFLNEPYRISIIVISEKQKYSIYVSCLNVAYKKGNRLRSIWGMPLREINFPGNLLSKLININSQCDTLPSEKLRFLTLLVQ